MKPPFFTRTHYRHLIREMRKMRDDGRQIDQTVDLLADIFERDNPDFRRDLFTALVCSEQEKQ